MILVYFLQVLNGVICLFWAGLTLSIVLAIGLFIGVIIQKDEVNNHELYITFIHEEEKTRIAEAQAKLEKYKANYNIVKKRLVKSCISVFVFAFLLIAIPTKKQAIEIVAVGSAIEFATNNEKIKQLPDKLVDCIDAYLSDIQDNK